MPVAMQSRFASSTRFIQVTDSPSFVQPYADGDFSFRDLCRIGIILTVASALIISSGLVLAGLPEGTVNASVAAAAAPVALPGDH
jgi:sodium-dependent dicarboxylate transporter 2/3/5